MQSQNSECEGDICTPRCDSDPKSKLSKMMFVPPPSTYKRGKRDKLTKSTSFRQGVPFISETHTPIGTELLYKPNNLGISVAEAIKDETTTQYITGHIKNGLMELFLPSGYPDSVSDDYIDYQFWDTIQAFCSTITGTFTTQAMLRGVGVGNEAATPLAATITWILKDGSGMIGKILFAWWKGEDLDCDCKQWRLVADVLNDTALIFEFLLPIFNSVTIYVLCITSVMKSVVGVAGSATRASITQHQAIKGNMGDVAAKDQSQETCVNLIGSLFGIFLLTSFQDNQHWLWFCFMIFVALHIISNYFAIRALVFNTLNVMRFVVVLRMYLRFDTVAPPLLVNKKEPLWTSTHLSAKPLCGFEIHMGETFKDTVKDMRLEQLKEIMLIFAGRDYLLIPDLEKREIYIALTKDAEPLDAIMAYFHAIIYGIALCQYNNIDLNFTTKRQLHHVTPLQRLDNLMKGMSKPDTPGLELFPMDKHVLFHEFAHNEITHFFTALSINGWDYAAHSLPIGSWRINLSPEDIKPRKMSMSEEIRSRKMS